MHLHTPPYVLPFVHPLRVRRTPSLWACRRSAWRGCRGWWVCRNGPASRRICRRRTDGSAETLWAAQFAGKQPPTDRRDWDLWWQAQKASFDRLHKRAVELGIQPTCEVAGCRNLDGDVRVGEVGIGRVASSDILPDVHGDRDRRVAAA